MCHLVLGISVSVALQCPGNCEKAEVWVYQFYTIFSVEHATEASYITYREVLLMGRAKTKYSVKILKIWSNLAIGVICLDQMPLLGYKYVQSYAE